MRVDNSFPHEPRVAAQSVQMSEPQLMHVIKRFQHACQSGVFPGGQLVVRRFGKIVVNEACGIARGYRDTDAMTPLDVTAHTLFPVFSIGKAIAATAIAMLEHRGMLSIDQRVAEFIPAFHQSDKHDITLLDVLTHRAGIIVPALSTREYKEASRERMLHCLIHTKSLYPRGVLAYAPTECGIVLCEIIRVLTGKKLATFVSDDIARPLGLPQLHYGLAHESIDSVAHSYWLGNKVFMLAGTNFADHFEQTNNSQLAFNTTNPAYTLVSNAANLAAFFECLLHQGMSAQQLLPQEKIQQYTKTHVCGWSNTTRSMMALGLGFQTGMTLFPCAYGYWNTSSCFGHVGCLSSMAFADHNTGLSVAIVTNGNRSPLAFASLFIPLAHRLRTACSKHPSHG